MSRVAIITGASGGIGSAVSKELHARDYNRVLLDLNMSVQNTMRTLTLKCDVTKPDEIQTAVSQAIERFGRIDILFNGAGRSHLGTVEELSLDDLDAVFDVNVRGTLNVSRAVLPYMKRQRSGYIINMGSMRGVECARGKTVYSISKFATRAFSKTLAIEMREHGIKVTVINPGFVQTDLICHRIKEEQLQPSDLTQPEDIAHTVVWLLGLSPGAEVVEVMIGRLW